MRHVILGNGAAGISAAEKLRDLCPSDEIIVISKEDTCAYTKCMLPDYVGGKLSKEKILIRDAAAYNKNRITLILGENILRIDVKDKFVSISDGKAISYDKLLIAVGGTPFVPPIPGLDKVEYYCINTLGHADIIKEKAFEDGKAIILGAGLTGIEMSFALKRLGMEVTIVEREKRVLPNQLDQGASDVMIDIIRHEGINLLVGTTVDEVVSDGMKAVKLSNGQSMEYDMLIVSIGTRSNIGLVKDTGIKCNKGILVDEYMKTSVGDVYAAGDVAEAISKLSNEYVSCYMWPNAMAQGKCAAYSMAGQPQEYSFTAAIQNPCQVRDFPFISMGLVNPVEDGYETMVDYQKDRRIYRKIVLQDNIVKGMIFLNDTRTANSIAGLIRKGTDTGEFKHRLLDQDFKL